MGLLIWLAVIPGIIIALLIYKSDRTEKEPKKELIKAFLLGIVSIIITLILSAIFGILDIELDRSDLLNVAFYSFISIALIEEFSKWICGYLFLKRNKNYDYMFDGIVYMSFISLGFATLENILYTFSGGISTAIIRAITTVPAHAFFGIFSGYYLSLAKKEKINNNPSLSKKYFFLSLLMPTLLHGFYDFCLLTDIVLLYLVYLVFVVVLYVISISKVKGMLKIEERFEKRKKQYCTNCGNKVEHQFCSNCGKRVDE